MKNAARKIVKSFPPVYRLINRMRGWRVGDPNATVDYIEVGGDGGDHNYGAWVAPKGLLNEKSIVYSFGIGEDVSFDLQIMSQFGCEVFAYDPTPKAVDYAKKNVKDPRFNFSAVGLAACDGVVSFDPPENDDPSFKMPSSPKADIDTNHSFPVARLATLMAQNRHEHIDLLKMDIEGFEYEVIDDMIGNKISPTCIILEFHHFQRKDKKSTQDAVKKLFAAGYKNFWISDLGAEYGFVRSDWK